MPAHKIIKNLTKKGTRVLGVGCYSAVLSSGSDKVIKVGADMGDPWLDYYHIVVKPLQANTHIPRVHSFHAEDSYYIATMERLTEVYKHPSACKIADLVRDYIDTIITEDDIKDELEAFPDMVPNVNEFMQAVNIIKTNTVFNSKKLDSQGNTLDEIWYEGYEDRCLDIHTGNLMLRDGVIVITDPWCNIDMQDIPDLSCWAEENLEDQSWNQ
jgi:hypothetical protein